jgi:pyruvate dehydrogenase E1 component beta subunit
MREITFIEAIREALRNELQRDKSVFMMGEGIGPHGSAFKQTLGLWEEFGDDRVRDTPISEAAVTGTAVGAAVCGMRPVIDLMWVDFFAVAMDQIVNQAAKLKYMSGDQLKVPMVVRGCCGAFKSNGAQHSQSLHSWFVHIPGLKVVMPSTPYDAKGLLISAIRDDDPVIYLEHKALYKSKGSVPEKEYIIPLGKAETKRKGEGITAVATGFMVSRTLEAANEAANEGISVEVIDPRTLWPLDKETILKSVEKTGHLVVIDEGYGPCGFGAEIASLVAEESFDYLDAPVKRVNAHYVPIPFSPSMENFVIPDKNRILEAFRSVI